jgi:predicted transcriptional regulator of viral defense system
MRPVINFRRSRSAGWVFTKWFLAHDIKPRRGFGYTLAEAAKLAPKGFICLTSALAYHELTDQIPAKVWMGFPR